MHYPLYGINACSLTGESTGEELMTPAHGPNRVKSMDVGMNGGFIF